MRISELVESVFTHDSLLRVQDVHRQLKLAFKTFKQAAHLLGFEQAASEMERVLELAQLDDFYIKMALKDKAVMQEYTRFNETRDIIINVLKTGVVPK
jgi:hypothetical protein